MGSHQADDFKSHTHTSNAQLNTGGNSDGGGGGGSLVSFAPATINATGGAETRPRNNIKLACIKY